jgi:hypothetical protein
MTLTRLFRRQPPAPKLPLIAAADPNKVTPDQRKTLIAWLDREDTKLALSLVEGTKPSVFVQPHNRESRLLQLQGWESFRNTLLGLRYSKEEIKAMIEEHYPDEE